jgi:hypothetical protein
VQICKADDECIKRIISLLERQEEKLKVNNRDLSMVILLNGSFQTSSWVRLGENEIDVCLELHIHGSTRHVQFHVGDWH